MAHEVESMIYTGEIPWHGLGTKFDVPPTLEEAIKLAGLDWTVRTEPIFDGNGVLVPDGLITRRSSDMSILGNVGPFYEPFQNDKAFEFFRPFLDAGQASIETAGSLRQGKRVFVLCKINRDPLTIVGDDTVEKYVLLSNSHDGTFAVRAGFTPIRVVCANTLSLAIDDKASRLIRVKHTKNVADNVAKVAEIMNLADQNFEATAAQYRLLASKDINSADLEKYVKIVFCSPKALTEAGPDSKLGERLLAEIIPLFENGRGNNLPGVRGTYWAAYNAVTEYIQHERGDDKAVRLEQAWFGNGATQNKKALDTALAMVA